MAWKVLAGLFVGLVPSPAAAADWWWIGLNGDPPNRVVTYVDLETASDDKNGAIEVWTLAIGETPLPNGQQHQATQYALRCRQRSLATLGRIAYDGAGSAMRMAELPPSAFGEVAPGSIGESILNLACGRPVGTEVRITDPVEHASTYLVAAGSRLAERRDRQGRTAEDPSLAVGTGFFVGPAGHVLTSYHVVEGAERIACRTAEGDIHPARLERGSRANDLALLRVDARPAHHLALAPANSLRPGQRVFTIGYGAANFLGISEPRFTEGSISALSGARGEDAYMQISVPVQPGNSGGPLLNESGQVVGVIAAQAAVETFLEAEGTLPQSINWAIKSDYASPLVGPHPPQGARGREAAIELTRRSICLVVAERPPG